MVGWMDGWIGMWTDGGSVDEWMDGWMEREMSDPISATPQNKRPKCW